MLPYSYDNPNHQYNVEHIQDTNSQVKTYIDARCNMGIVPPSPVKSPTHIYETHTTIQETKENEDPTELPKSTPTRP